MLVAICRGSNRAHLLCSAQWTNGQAVQVAVDLLDAALADERLTVLLRSC